MADACNYATPEGEESQWPAESGGETQFDFDANASRDGSEESETENCNRVDLGKPGCEEGLG